MLMLSKGPTFSHFTERFRCDGKGHIGNNKETPRKPLIFRSPESGTWNKDQTGVSYHSVQRGVYLALGGLLCWCEEAVGLRLEQKHLIWKAWKDNNYWLNKFAGASVEIPWLKDTRHLRQTWGKWTTGYSLHCHPKYLRHRTKSLNIWHWASVPSLGALVGLCLNGL